MSSAADLLQSIKEKDAKVLARAISLVENESKIAIDLLKLLPFSNKKILGITGAPGSGKSTLTDALIGECVERGLSVGVMCIDPSSPFNKGALLGDRIRMSEWYNNPNVFIRSLASKGSLGGLHPKVIEITELMKAAWFDVVIVETVGVGQSEIDIAGLADITTVVLVPESGDIVQTMKAGIMEIADVFVVNKSDRPEADALYNNLKQMLQPRRTQREIPVFKTTATAKQGVQSWADYLLQPDVHQGNGLNGELLLNKVLTLISAHKLQGLNKDEMLEKIKRFQEEKRLNLYKLAEEYF